MMLIALEPIEAGAEIRINYEHGGSIYWVAGSAPAETAWRRLRLRCPPPVPDAEPIMDRLTELQTAAALRQEAPPCAQPRLPKPPIAWEGPGGGDERLRAVVALFATGSERDLSPSAWALVSTHLPGRTGRECRMRWLGTPQRQADASLLRAP